jgi:hypothetical protein
VGNGNASDPTVNQQRPRWKRTSTDVVDFEFDALPGRPIPKHRALAARASRDELAQGMHRNRWLDIETARTAGATWDEIDTALHYKPGLAHSKYQTGLTLQKSFDLVSADRQDPGPSEEPQL